MKIAALLNSKPVAIAAGVAVGAFALYWIGKRAAGAIGDKAGELASQAGALVNPADDRNVVNRGTSSLVELLTHGRALSLGDLLYQVRTGEIFGRDPVVQNASNKPFQRGPSARYAAAAALSPLQPDQKETIYARR